jgi:hypothetical protein
VLPTCPVRFVTHLPGSNLYQGTTLVVPYSRKKERGFSPCGFFHKNFARILR